MRAMKTLLTIIRTRPRVSGFTIFGMTPGGSMPGGGSHLFRSQRRKLSSKNGSHGVNHHSTGLSRIDGGEVHRFKFR